MRRLLGILAIGCLGLWLGVAAPAWAGEKKVTCAPDSVAVGPVCIDKYEASVWEIAPANTSLINRIKEGTVTLAALTANGAIQRGVDYNEHGAGCPETGNGCTNFYAVSIQGVTPSRYLTWFQAAAAARNAGKRLPSNAEWQAAALGTPDDITYDWSKCNIYSTYLESTGSRPGCVSDVGAFDMVGNLWEWVADWTPRKTTCVIELFNGDLNCLSGAPTDSGPAALTRGGGFQDSFLAGVFAVGSTIPSDVGGNIGFRAAR